ncbi:MAG: hypothetical protein ABIG61_12585 [Planctomycetota bacterium]
MLDKRLTMFLYTLVAIGIFGSAAWADPNVVFSDDFEGVVAGGPPDSALWTIAASPVVVADTNSPDPNQVLDVSGEVHSKIGSPPTSEFWVECYIYTPYDEPINMTFRPSAGGPFDLCLNFYVQANVAWGGYASWITTGEGSDWIFTTGAASPLNGYEKWVVGVTITDQGTGAGTFSIYRDGVALRIDEPYSPITANAKPGKVGFLAEGYVDAVKVYDGDPVQAVPLNCGDAGTVYKASDFNEDCYVDFKDYCQFASVWFDCTDPANGLCD